MLIGEQLKELRSKHNLTIRDLAALTGLSAGFISNVERNINSPTISSMNKICHALDTNIMDFFRINDKEQRNVVRKDERKLIFSSEETNVQYELFFSNDKSLRPLYVTLHPGGTCGGYLFGHPGDEICIIMSGSMELSIGGNIFTLQEGDAAYIEANQPHKYRNVADVDCVSLWVRQNINWLNRSQAHFIKLMDQENDATDK